MNPLMLGFALFAVGILGFGLISTGVVIAKYAQPEAPSEMPDDTPSDPPPSTTPTPPPPPISNDPGFTNPLNIGQKTYVTYDDYLQKFVKANGAAISNYAPIQWCPNECIGCDDDITSEAVGRSLVVSAGFQDKPITDRYTSYYWDTMRFPATGHMMWKVDITGVAGSCGGQNSAIDGELEAIEGLAIARKYWSSDSEGRTYLKTQKAIQDSVKLAAFDTPYGKTLPHCAYPAGSAILPCGHGDANGGPMAYIGYLNIVAMNEACKVDSAWCAIRDGSKNLIAAAIQGQTIYTSYGRDTGQFGFHEHFIHNLWVLEHAIESGDPLLLAKAKPLYDMSRARYYQDGMLCQEFKNTGCKFAHPSLFVYAEYLEMAVDLGDDQFAFDMADEIFKRCPNAASECGIDNYKRVATLQALAKATEAGVVIE